MPDAPVHDAALPLIEAFVWLVVPLAFFLSLIWAGAVLATIVKGKGPELRERILHARKAGEPWLHYWLSIPEQSETSPYWLLRVSIGSMVGDHCDSPFTTCHFGGCRLYCCLSAFWFFGWKD
jgi:hypothetical protein